MARVGLMAALGALWALAAPAVAQPLEEVGTEADARRLLEQGIRMWRQRQPGSWLVLRGIPPETAAGRRAQRLLLEADQHYQHSLDLLHEGHDEEGRAEFEQGSSIGPIDPHHYYELAEIFRERGIRVRAIEAYGRYLGFMNQAGEPVDPETLERIIIYISGEQDLPSLEPPPEPERPGWQLYVGLTAGALAPLALLLLVYLRRGKTLDELVDENPDLHPRIAYAISCLRHELLKHRLGVLGDVVGALRADQGLTPRQASYLRDRLFGGESLSGLWKIYLDTFDRLAGRRLLLTERDRDFRRAWLAVRSLEQMRDRFDQPDEQMVDTLEEIHQQIRRFDRHLKWLSERLLRTHIDGQMLREAVFSVQSEPRAAAVRLDEIRFVEPEPDIYVEVFRSDLLIVLKNLVRNAVLALGDEEESRRALGLEVAVRTEPTGDESVLIKVLDTSTTQVSTAEIYRRRLEHGLGLVAAAVTRYGGSVFVEPGHDDYCKAVVVRFFRALGEGQR